MATKSPATAGASDHHAKRANGTGAATTSTTTLSAAFSTISLDPNLPEPIPTELPTNIYELNTLLIERLTRTDRLYAISIMFSKQANNAERVRYVHSVYRNENYFPQLALRRPKDNKAARLLRKAGNRLFLLKGANLVKALELYNQSLCLSESGQSDFAITLANRSAVYYEMRLIGPCLQNIRYARLTRQYPECLTAKLAKREADCAQHAEACAPNEDWLQPTTAKMLMAGHREVPFVGEALEVRESPQYGKHVVATRRVLPGEVLAIERPFTRVLQPSLRFQRCWHCLREYGMNLMPCQRCCTVMYCSAHCKEEADDTYHAFECPIIDYLMVVFNKVHLLAMRTVLMGMLAWGGSLERLQLWLTEHGGKKVDAFSAPESCVEKAKAAKEKAGKGAKSKTAASVPLYTNNEQRLFHQVYSLNTNEALRTNGDLFQRASIAAMQYELLIGLTPMRQQCEGNIKAQDTLLELLFHFCQVCPTNFHTLSTVEVSAFEDSTFGAASYPFSSLLNHSCAPNVLRVTADANNVLVALRVIEKDQQVFDNYGFHHCLESQHMRRKHLSAQYNFHCDCTACRNDYPAFANLVRAPIPDIVNQDDLHKLSRFTSDCSDLFFKYTEFLTEADQYYPCVQVAGAQECLKTCFNVLMRNVPLTMRLASQAEVCAAPKPAAPPTPPTPSASTESS